MIPLSSIKKEQNQQKQLFIDLNCDLGQSYGVYRNDSEFSLLPYVSSVNISCGSHAGDPVTIMNTLKQVKEYNVAIGAHIGYPDVQGFGYRTMQLSDEELQAVVLYQMGALNSLAQVYGLEIEHVRPHGALYVEIAKNKETAISVAKAISKFNPWLILVGANSEALNIASAETNIRIAPEVQLDKKYNIDGSINFDAESNTSYDYAISQLESLIKDSTVKNIEGSKTKIDFKTIHLNLKSEASLNIAKKAKELISQPVPVPVNMVSKTGWI